PGLDPPGHGPHGRRPPGLDPPGYGPPGRRRPGHGAAGRRPPGRRSHRRRTRARAHPFSYRCPSGATETMPCAPSARHRCFDRIISRVRRGKADPCAGGAETDKTPDVADVFIVFLGTFGRRRREGRRARKRRRKAAWPAFALSARSVLPYLRILSLGRYIRVPNNIGGTDAHFRVSR